VGSGSNSGAWTVHPSSRAARSRGWSSSLAGIAFVVVAAVLIGAALAALPFIWGMVVAFAVVVLVAALVLVELRRLWAAATIRAFVSATALDNGQRLLGR